VLQWIQATFPTVSKAWINIMRVGQGHAAPLYFQWAGPLPNRSG